MRPFALLTAVAVALLLTGCSPDESQPAERAAHTPEPTAPEHRPIETIADEYLAALLEVYPEMGTYYALPGARHDRLSDNSLDALAAWRVREDDWLAELEAIEIQPAVGSRDWIALGVLRETLESAVSKRVCRNELWQASSITAWYTYLPVLFELQPVDTADTREQALDRLQALPAYVDTEIDKLRRGLELGYSAPQPTVEPVPAEVLALLEDNSPLLSPGVRSGDADYAARVRALFDAELAPAIQRFADFIRADYLPRARSDIALSANPDGAACYPALVRSFATIGPQASAIHDLGLRQMEGIRGEMQAIIDEHFTGATIETFLRQVNSDPRYTFTSEDEVLQYSVDALQAARAAMHEAFGRLPTAEVEIKPYPAYRQSGTGEYQSPSEDGTRPGVYYIAVTDPTRRSRATQQSVLYHETYPGHHLQVALALELGDRVHPVARYLGNSGFAEGWGLYSERLADELGLYSSPLDRMGMLSDQAARAARLVVDTGMHTQGWSRQQAVDYMLNNTAWAAVDIESEINRYISWPGQANAYMLGMLEFRRLRNLAEAELGDRFDLRAFHDRVLGSGGITLPMLDASIRAWIEEQKGAP